MATINQKFDKSRPICPQIYEQICVDIACGALEAGARLYSVREVAVKIGVTPNTVQKAFCMLEEDGLVYSAPGSGWFVSENTETAQLIRQRLVDKKTEDFFLEMENLGLDSQAVKSIIKEWGQ